MNNYHVKKARKMLGLSQPKFAVVLGRNVKTIVQYEKGHCPCPMVVALAIEALLNREGLWHHFKVTVLSKNEDVADTA